MTPNLDSIPAELKRYSNWVLWKLEERNGKKTKIPYQVNERRADSTNPDTWNKFDYVEQAIIRRKEKFSGLGFVFSEDLGIIGVDWDHIRNPETGEFDEEALEEIISLGSYAEISQSGTGVHVLVKGKIPGVKRRKGNFEIYSKDRFFVITGSHIEGTPREITENQEAINKLYEKRFGISEPKTEGKQPEKNSKLSDSEVIEIASRANNSEKFKSLYNGDTSGYNSDSEADLALCSILAFYTQDAGQIDTIFRSSGLYRDKWEREYYRERTINTALKGVTETYNPENKGAQTLDYTVSLQKIAPSPDNAIRVRQAKKFISETLMDLREDDADEIIMTIVSKYFVLTKQELANVKKYYKLEKEEEKKRKKQENVVFNMDRVSGRNLVYHTLANEYMENHQVKYIGGSFRTYTNGIYPSNEEAISFIKNEIMKLGLKHGVPLAESHVNEVIKVLEMYNPVKMEDCEPNKDSVIVVNNGILNLKTWELEPFDPEKVYLSKIPVDYNPNALEPVNFNKYLKTAFKNNEQQLLIIQELTGYLLCRHHKYQYIFYLLGDGGNGKGVFLNLLEYLLGEDNTTAFSLHDLSENNKAEYNIASMYGKLANICGDIGDKRLETTEIIKKLSSGTDPIEGRFPYGRPFKFVNYAKLIFAMNKLPKKSAFTTGDKRRDLIINFNNPISESDEEIKGLADVIRDAGEMPGILNWAIEGLKRLETNQNFSDSRTVAQRGLEYDKKSNPIKYFVNDCLEEDPGNATPNTFIYERYIKYRKQHGMPELSQEEIKTGLIHVCNQLGWNLSETQCRIDLLPKETQAELKERGKIPTRPRVFRNVRIVEDETSVFDNW